MSVESRITTLWPKRFQKSLSVSKSLEGYLLSKNMKSWDKFFRIIILRNVLIQLDECQHRHSSKTELQNMVLLLNNFFILDFILSPR